MADDPTYTPKDTAGYTPTFGVKIAPSSAPPNYTPPKNEPVEKSEEGPE